MLQISEVYTNTIPSGKFIQVHKKAKQQKPLAHGTRELMENVRNVKIWNELWI